MKANERQVGGTHYGLQTWQHWDWIAENFGPGYHVGMATKYVCRWREKDGRKDLEKARHYIQKVIELHQAGLPCPPVRIPKNILKLREVYQLTESEFAFCTLCSIYTHANELKDALDLLDNIIDDNFPKTMIAIVPKK